MDLENFDHGAIVNRSNPLHLGHEVVKQTMLRMFGYANSIDLLGSANAPFSLRNYFSYEERRGFVKTVFPQLKVAPIPDFPTNHEWLVALDDLLLAAGFDPKKTLFFGGCEEDVEVLLENGRQCYIVNRFDGTTPKISATEVRDALIYDRALNGLLNPLIAPEVQKLFKSKWELFKKR